MTQNTKLRKYPKILADELNSALRSLEGLAPEQRTELLRRYQRNRMKMIAAVGLDNVNARVEGLELIPFEHHDNIRRLDEAFQKLRHYNNGGAEDYVAADVERTINHIRGREIDVETGAEVGSKEWRSSVAKHAAVTRHSQSGGSHDKRQKVRELWATGKYRSREQCADLVCSELGISRTTARKALNNTPDPNT